MSNKISKVAILRVKPTALEKCVEYVRQYYEKLGTPLSLLDLMASANQMEIVRIHASRHHNETADLLDLLDDEDFPIDQFSAREAGKAKAGFNDWAKWRRWPWIYVEKAQADKVTPPWIGRFPENHLGASIGRCLQYCMDNSEHLPERIPSRSWTVFSWDSDVSVYPMNAIVFGDFIPRRLSPLFRKARCIEALAYVYWMRGGDLMDEVRKLIAVPGRERLAMALAVTSSPRFHKEVISEDPAKEVVLELEQAGDGRRAFAEIIKQHPKILGRLRSAARGVFTKLFSNPSEIIGAPQLAGATPGKRASGGRRVATDKALEMLASVQLAERVGDGWKLGRAAFV